MQSAVLTICACALSVLQVTCQPASNENKLPVLENPIETQVDSRPRPENPLRRALSSLPGVRLGRLRSGQDIESLRQSLSAHDWNQYTSPPISSAPECFVEIKVTQRIPGRCTRLGTNRLPACQAQDLLSMDYDSCGDED